jgi:hypothetical protein
MVLRAIERSLYSPKVETPDVPRGLTLEHVMPRQWRQHWPLPDTDPEEEALRAQDRDARLDRVGNLTLATGALNSTLSNLPWSEKQLHLNAATKLLLNNELITDFGSRFDDSAIDRRTLLLASRICSIWPGPDAARLES